MTGLNQAATATSPNSFTNVQKSLNFDGEMKREDQLLRLCRAKPGQYLGPVANDEETPERAVGEQSQHSEVYFSGDFKCKSDLFKKLATLSWHQMSVRKIKTGGIKALDPSLCPQMAIKLR